MKKTLLILMLLLACALFGAANAENPAQEFVSDHFRYILMPDGTAKITGYTMSDKKIQIPNQLDGHTVTAIGDYAFSDISNLEEITIPDSVTSIGSNPFRYCQSLAKINLSRQNRNFATIDGALYNRADRKLISSPNALKSSIYSVPNGIQIIGDSAFTYCISLAEVILPNGVKEIESSAFSYCYALSKITLPDTVTTIGDLAFYDCRSLTEITIPAGVTAIGANPFANSSLFRTIQVAPGNARFSAVDGVLFDTIDKRLVCHPCALETSVYTIPDGTAFIGASAFEYCGMLKQVHIPSSVSSIGNRAFFECESLEKAALPANLTAIEDEAFNYCFTLSEISIPKSVETIGANPFAYCLSLKKIYVDPENPCFATIDGVLFDTNQKKLITYPCAFELSEYSVPEGTLIIGSSAFAYARPLKKVSLPDGATAIEDYAFALCSSLAEIPLPDSITAIGKLAFDSCYALKEVILPRSIEAIGENAFDFCMNAVFKADKGSFAETWLTENNIKYQYTN